MIDPAIQALSDFFKSNDKVFSRREYSRLKDKPHSIEFYERRFGWGNAKRSAADLAGLVEAEPSSLEKEKELDRVTVDRPFALDGIDDEDNPAWLAGTLMVGLQRKGVSQKYREMLADFVRQVDYYVRSLPRTPFVSPDSDKDTACLVLSDFHGGKKVIDDRGNVIFNQDICRKRISFLADKVVEILCERQNPTYIDEIVLLLVGDFVDGSGIYETQMAFQDVHFLPNQVSLVEGCLWGLITQLRTLGLKVRVGAVRGNHGRQSKFAPLENNFDLLVYEGLSLMAHYEDPEGVSVEYSFSEYFNMDIKGRRVHLRHEAPPQTETPAAKSKFAGWNNLHGVDVLVSAHLHHPAHSAYMNIEHIMNGSIVGGDDLSERMALGSRPSQALFGINSGGITFHRNLFLDVA